MNREEILERSRNERRDEGEVEAENRGRHIGLMVFTIAFLAILLFNFLCKQKSYGYVALYWTFVVGESYTKYKFTKDKLDLIIVVGAALACIGSFSLYIMDGLEQTGWVS